MIDQDLRQITIQVDYFCIVDDAGTTKYFFQRWTIDNGNSVSILDIDQENLKADYIINSLVFEIPKETDIRHESNLSMVKQVIERIDRVKEDVGNSGKRYFYEKWNEANGFSVSQYFPNRQTIKNEHAQNRITWEMPISNEDKRKRWIEPLKDFYK